MPAPGPRALAVPHPRKVVPGPLPQQLLDGLLHVASLIVDARQTRRGSASRQHVLVRAIRRSRPDAQPLHLPDPGRAGAPGPGAAADRAAHRPFGHGWCISAGGREERARIAIEEWAGASPVYTRRMSPPSGSPRALGLDDPLRVLELHPLLNPAAGVRRRDGRGRDAEGAADDGTWIAVCGFGRLGPLQALVRAVDPHLDVEVAGTADRWPARSRARAGHPRPRRLPWPGSAPARRSRSSRAARCRSTRCHPRSSYAGRHGRTAEPRPAPRA